MRIIEIVLTDLAKDKLMAEEEMQRLINNKDVDVVSNIALIKSKLNEVVLIEGMISKWKSYTTTDNNDNNDNKN